MTEPADAHDDAGARRDAASSYMTTRRPWVVIMNAVAARLLNLFVLVVTVSTVLFFLLRLTGDPAAALAGADATADQLLAIRQAYGLDRSLPEQFLSFLMQTAQGDFGRSLASGVPAIDLILEALPATLSIAVPAMLLSVAGSLVIGAWLGSGHSGARHFVSSIVFVLQGTPGFVVGLLLIQLFAVELTVLPSMGRAGVYSYLLPITTLSLFLFPKQVRLVATSVDGALRRDYVRTARSIGASPGEILMRHVMPNAVIGLIALIGAQSALLLSGAVITESLFGWPGLGALLLSASQTLDFPVVQAIALISALLVFVINGVADAVVAVVDPRVRRP
jgi:ABC-type dipeptide/oligopeptide/nickel transport system permease component